MKLPITASITLSLAAITISTAALAQTPVPSTAPATAPTTTSAPAPLDPKWTDLLARLASEDPAIRDAAQKELAALPNSARPFLKRLAAQAPNTEIKSSLAARTQQMEIDDAINPPHISIDLKNASFTDVADALTKATGAKFDTWSNNQSSDTCTLKMTDVPFWEVFAAINKQMPLNIQEDGERPRIEHGTTPMANFVRVNGLAVFPLSITRSSSVDFQQPPAKQAQPPHFLLAIMVVADPQMKLLSANQPDFSLITDDAGNVLFKGSHTNYGYYDNGFIWSQTVTIPIPNNVGKKIVSAKGDIRILVPLDTQTVEVPNIEKTFNTPIAIAGRTVKFSKLEVKGNSIEFSVNVQQSTLGKVFQSDKDPGIRLTFLDANDAEIWSSNITGGSSGTVGSDHLISPLKIRLTTPTRTKEVTIPFELKDIPLPAK